MRKRSRKSAQLLLEFRRHRLAATPVDGDEHRVEHARPSPCAGGALHAGMTLGGRGVVGLGHRALLRAERLRRVQLCLRRGLGIGTAAGRQPDSAP